MAWNQGATRLACHNMKFSVQVVLILNKIQGVSFAGSVLCSHCAHGSALKLLFTSTARMVCCCTYYSLVQEASATTKTYSSILQQSRHSPSSATSDSNHLLQVGTLKLDHAVAQHGIHSQQLATASIIAAAPLQTLTDSYIHCHNPLPLTATPVSVQQTL